MDSYNVAGGEGGIRTPGTGLGPYDGLANRCFRPLSHLSAAFLGLSLHATTFSLYYLPNFPLTAALIFQIRVRSNNHFEPHIRHLSLLCRSVLDDLHKLLLPSKVRSTFPFSLRTRGAVPGWQMRKPIYLDNHATTPVDPRVLKAMLPYLTEKFGNASSRSHSFGWEAEHAVERARKQIAALIGATPEEIIFTSGATESDNLALKGVAEMYGNKGNHIITAATEHKAVLDTCKTLQKRGFEITLLPVDPEGLVDCDLLRTSIKRSTILISIMHANNEIGVIQPVREIGRIAKEYGIFFHTDATQSVGKVPVDVIHDHIDLLSISAHKMYGPKGIGALYVRRKDPRVHLAAQIDGGGHERQMRSGTLNVPGIVGLGEACQICQNEMAEESVRIRRLRDKLKTALQEGLDEVYLNGSLTYRLPGNLNMSFAYVESESLMMGLTDVAVSSGSACTSAVPEPSYVLKALGVNDHLAHSAIRFGIGRFNTEEEIDYVGGRIIEVVQRLRELSPMYEILKQQPPRQRPQAEE